MKLSEYQAIFSYNIADLILYANSIGVALTFGGAYRTKPQQLLYYFGYTIKVVGKELKLVKDKKRSWTLYSKHRKRLAVDFNHFIDNKLTYDKKKLQQMGDYWESLHPKNKWGGNFSKGKTDTPHYQMTI